MSAATILRLPPGHDLAEIKGDVMMPTYRPGTLVVVDRSTRRVTGEGYYFVSDGVGEVARVVSQGSRHGLWRVSQENKAYLEYEATPGEITICGRIVAVFQTL
jgi:phage repressor protein C with HTH and peptisase S24 domain